MEGHFVAHQVEILYIASNDSHVIFQLALLIGRRLQQNELRVNQE